MLARIGNNCPFDKIYDKNGIIKPAYQHLTRIKCKKPKSKITKERMQNFMSPEKLHQCLGEIIEMASAVGYNNKNKFIKDERDLEALVHQKLSNGMEIGDFCLQCIMTRWAF